MQNILTSLGLPAETAAERARSVALATAILLVTLTGRALILALVGVHVFGNAGAAAIAPDLAIAFAGGVLGVATLAVLHLKT